VWFDYSFSPPKVNVGRHAELVTVNVTPTGSAESLDITPFTEQRVPSVRIVFETTATNGQMSISNDIAPAGADGFELGALVATVNLAGGGGHMTKLKQEVGVEPLPDADDMDAVNDFLANLVGWLDEGLNDDPEEGFNNSIRNFSVEEAAFSKLNDDGSVDEDLDAELYPNRLTSGAIATWMQQPNSAASVNVTKARLEARVSFETWLPYVAGEHAEKKTGVVEDMIISVDFIATDATTKLYEIIASSTSTPGEPQPTGLAQSLYDALNRPQYRGRITLTERECGNTAIGVGNTLNILGLRDEWAAMNALITDVSEDLANGRTTITFGPTPQLSLGDLIELLQTSRTRRKPSNYQARETGDNSGATAILPELSASLASNDKEVARSYDAKVDPAVVSGASAIVTDAKNGLQSVAYEEPA